MKTKEQAAEIRAKFAEYLASSVLDTASVIARVAREYGVPLSVVIDAITKGQPRKVSRK